jgi:hypothetical protein
MGEKEIFLTKMLLRQIKVRSVNNLIS